MFKNLLIGLLVVVVAAIATVFAWLNPGQVTLDLAFAGFETTIAMAVIVALVVGWLFGLACIGIYIISLLRQRRRLRRALTLAETEVSNLRGLPMQDAG